MCSTCNLSVIPAIRASEFAYTIPISDFASKSSRCKFQVAYCTSPEKVNLALKPFGIKIPNMDRMKALADYYDRGEAKAFYKVDLWNDVLAKIEFTPEEKSKTECNLACTY